MLNLILITIKKKKTITLIVSRFLVVGIRTAHNVHRYTRKFYYYFSLGYARISTVHPPVNSPAPVDTTRLDMARARFSRINYTRCGVKFFRSSRSFSVFSCFQAVYRRRHQVCLCAADTTLC